jgi:hypothetical protein
MRHALLESDDAFVSTDRNGIQRPDKQIRGVKFDISDNASLLQNTCHVPDQDPPVVMPIEGDVVSCSPALVRDALAFICCACGRPDGARHDARCGTTSKFKTKTVKGSGFFYIFNGSSNRRTKTKSAEDTTSVNETNDIIQEADPDQHEDDPDGDPDQHDGDPDQHDGDPDQHDGDPDQHDGDPDQHEDYNEVDIEHEEAPEQLDENDLDDGDEGGMEMEEGDHEMPDQTETCVGGMEIEMEDDDAREEPTKKRNIKAKGSWVQYRLLPFEALALLYRASTCKLEPMDIIDPVKVKTAQSMADTAWRTMRFLLLFAPGSGTANIASQAGKDYFKYTRQVRARMKVLVDEGADREQLSLGRRTHDPILRQLLSQQAFAADACLNPQASTSVHGSARGDINIKITSKEGLYQKHTRQIFAGVGSKLVATNAGAGPGIDPHTAYVYEEHGQFEHIVMSDITAHECRRRVIDRSAIGMIRGTVPIAEMAHAGTVHSLVNLSQEDIDHIVNQIENGDILIYQPKVGERFSSTVIRYPCLEKESVIHMDFEVIAPDDKRFPGDFAPGTMKLNPGVWEMEFGDFDGDTGVVKKPGRVTIVNTHDGYVRVMLTFTGHAASEALMRMPMGVAGGSNLVKGPSMAQSSMGAIGTLIDTPDMAVTTAVAYVEQCGADPRGLSGSTGADVFAAVVAARVSVPHLSITNRNGKWMMKGGFNEKNQNIVWTHLYLRSPKVLLHVQKRIWTLAGIVSETLPRPSMSWIIAPHEQRVRARLLMHDVGKCVRDLPTDTSVAGVCASSLRASACNVATAVSAHVFDDTEMSDLRRRFVGLTVHDGNVHTTYGIKHAVYTDGNSGRRGLDTSPGSGVLDVNQHTPEFAPRGHPAEAVATLSDSSLEGAGFSSEPILGPHTITDVARHLPTNADQQKRAAKTGKEGHRNMNLQKMDPMCTAQLDLMTSPGSSAYMIRMADGVMQRETARMKIPWWDKGESGFSKACGSDKLRTLHDSVHPLVFEASVGSPGIEMIQNLAMHCCRVMLSDGVWVGADTGIVNAGFDEGVMIEFQTDHKSDCTAEHYVECIYSVWNRLRESKESMGIQEVNILPILHTCSLPSIWSNGILAKDLPHVLDTIVTRQLRCSRTTPEEVTSSAWAESGANRIQENLDAISSKKGRASAQSDHMDGGSTKHITTVFMCAVRENPPCGGSQFPIASKVTASEVSYLLPSLAVSDMVGPPSVNEDTNVATFSVEPTVPVLVVVGVMAGVLRRGLWGLVAGPSTSSSGCAAMCGVNPLPHAMDDADIASATARLITLNPENVCDECSNVIKRIHHIMCDTLMESASKAVRRALNEFANGQDVPFSVEVKGCDIHVVPVDLETSPSVWPWALFSMNAIVSGVPGIESSRYHETESSRFDHETRDPIVVTMPCCIIRIASGDSKAMLFGDMIEAVHAGVMNSAMLSTYTNPTIRLLRDIKMIDSLGICHFDPVSMNLKSEDITLGLMHSISHVVQMPAVMAPSASRITVMMGAIQPMFHMLTSTTKSVARKRGSSRASSVSSMGPVQFGWVAGKRDNMLRKMARSIAQRASKAPPKMALPSVVEPCSHLTAPLVTGGVVKTGMGSVDLWVAASTTGDSLAKQQTLRIRSGPPYLFRTGPNVATEDGMLRQAEESAKMIQKINRSRSVHHNRVHDDKWVMPPRTTILSPPRCDHTGLRGRMATVLNQLRPNPDSNQNPWLRSFRRFANCSIGSPVEIATMLPTTFEPAACARIRDIASTTAAHLLQHPNDNVELEARLRYRHFKGSHIPTVLMPALGIAGVGDPGPDGTRPLIWTDGRIPSRAGRFRLLHVANLITSYTGKPDNIRSRLTMLPKGERHHEEIQKQRIMAPVDLAVRGSDIGIRVGCAVEKPVESNTNTRSVQRTATAVRYTFQYTGSTQFLVEVSFECSADRKDMTPHHQDMNSADTTLFDLAMHRQIKGCHAVRVEVEAQDLPAAVRGQTLPAASQTITTVLVDMLHLTSSMLHDGSSIM